MITKTRPVISELTCDDVDFKEWMRCVNNHCFNITTLTTEDMIDMCWKDLYDDGITVNEAVEQLLEQEGYYVNI